MWRTEAGKMIAALFHLNEIGDTSRHFIDSHREVELDITQNTNVFDGLNRAWKRYG
jgi:hypothetical protein